jgi:thiosulfate/3-mercaptopyruvate sulfurtransferase
MAVILQLTASGLQQTFTILIIIDARGSMPYRFGHIKNARPLGIEMVIMLADNGANLVIESAAAEKVFGGLGIDDSKKVIVYGEQDDPSSARIARSIIYHSHTDVKMLDIGFQAWRNAGLPVTRGIPQITPAQFKSKPRNDIRVDAEIIKARMDDPSFVVVDTRTPMEHMHANRGAKLCAA